LPLVEWSVRTLMYQAQEALHAFLRNLPNRWVAGVLRVFIFPRGRTYSAPSDEIARKVVGLMTTTGEARERLSQQAYTTFEPGNPLGLLQEALALAEQVAPLEKRLREAQKEGLIRADYLGEQIGEALQAGVIEKSEAADLQSYHDKVRSLLAVDDFSSQELMRIHDHAAGAQQTADSSIAASKKKPARKKKTTTKR
jgi:acyl-CoA dehydrogenase